MFKKFAAIAAILALVIGLSACEDEGTRNDKQATNRQLEQYQKVQPVPFYDWSQYRQTVISVIDAQAKGTATTSFFFNIGVQNPFKVCSSIGYPVATTAQITSPDQKVDSVDAVISQMEPSGVYTGDSSGTYVVCVVDGSPVPTYWEGYIHTEGGPAHWDTKVGMIVNDGKPTVEVKTK